MKETALGLIRFYQKSLSLFLNRTFYLADRSCRFSPTCSQYVYAAIARYGIIKGVWLGVRRLVRCHPFSPGGRDLLK